MSVVAIHDFVPQPQLDRGKPNHTHDGAAFAFERQINAARPVWIAICVPITSGGINRRTKPPVDESYQSRRVLPSRHPITEPTGSGCRGGIAVHLKSSKIDHLTGDEIALRPKIKVNYVSDISERSRPLDRLPFDDIL